MKKRLSNVPPSSRSSGPVSREMSPANNLRLWTIAPMLAALATGLQFVMGAWKEWPQRPFQPEELEGFTNTAKSLFRPDYDIRIYILGTGFTLALTLALGLLWRRRLRTVKDEDRLAWIRFILFSHILAAGILTILPLFWTNSPYPSFVFGCLGLLFCGAAFLAGGCKPLALPGWLLWPKAAWQCIGAALVAGLVVLLVYIPDTAQISSWSYQFEHFRHWDFYVMGPALAYRHGMALGADFFAHYGVGWPLLLAWLSQITPLSYKLAIHIGVVWGCIYFSALFFFLRMLLKNSAWGLTGVLLALSLQLFSGTDLPKWIWPSSTVLRYTADIFLFATLLAYARNGKAWLGLPTGLFAALCLLFATDVGILIMVCLGFYLVAVGRVETDDSQPRQTWGFILRTVLTFTVVLLTGLAIASRGTLIRPEFWIGWTEPFWLFGDGLYHLPVGTVIMERPAYAMAIIVLICYLVAVSRMLEGLYTKALTPQGLLVGLIALYGVATFTWFVFRSHPWNMHHSSISFCIVLTSYLAELHNAASRAALKSEPPRPYPLPPAAWAFVPGTCACVALVILLIIPGFQTYPNLLRWMFLEHFATPKIPAESYLFKSRRDAPLPKQFQPEIAKFRDVTNVMRGLSDDGRKTVAIMDYSDTHFLVEADLRPYFRYSPLLPIMLYWKQIQRIQQQILDNPPDYLLFPSKPQPDLLGAPINDVHERLLKTVQERFILTQRIYDFDVYRRKP